MNQDENLAKEERRNFILFSANLITAIIFSDEDHVLGKYFKWQSRPGSFKSSVCDLSSSFNRKGHNFPVDYKNTFVLEVLLIIYFY